MVPEFASAESTAVVVVPEGLRWNSVCHFKKIYIFYNKIYFYIQKRETCVFVLPRMKLVRLQLRVYKNGI